MNILLCGFESPLGVSFRSLLPQLPFECTLLDAATLATLSLNDLVLLLQEQHINLVLNLDHRPFLTAAKALEQVYVRIPERLAQAAANVNAMMLQLSDTQVFAGRANGSYRESDDPDTQVPYGALRWAGEQAVMVNCPQHIVLRTGELFGSEGENVMTRLLGAWRRQESAAVSLRYQFCPTPLPDAARVIVAMLKQLDCGISPWGVYHYCGTDAVSYHDFARLQRQILESQPDWDYPMAMHEIAEGYAALSWALDCSKIRETFGIKQHAWRAGFTSSIKQALALQASTDATSTD